jgi:hypothetical protein
MKELTLSEIADYFREIYPKATSINFEVNYHQHKLSVDSVFPHDGSFTIRTLDGEWLEGKVLENKEAV